MGPYAPQHNLIMPLEVFQKFEGKTGRGSLFPKSDIHTPGLHLRPQFLRIWGHDASNAFYLIQYYSQIGRVSKGKEQLGTEVEE